jgi:hypothetical protein
VNGRDGFDDIQSKDFCSKDIIGNAVKLEE